LASSSGKNGRTLDKFRKLLSRTDEKNQKLLLLMAQKMARPVRAKA